ncbi:Eukaryotic translation initiation factor 3 subunit D-like protein, partial [Dinothrombium tinctorium]
FGGGGQYAYFQDDDENTYQLVDTGRSGGKVQRGKIRIGQRNMRQKAGQKGAQQMQAAQKGGRGQRNTAVQGRGTKWQRQMRQKYDQKGQTTMKKRDASVFVKPTWRIIEEMDFPRLAKLSLPNLNEASDIYKCGSLEYYDKAYDRVTCKNEKRLIRVNSVSQQGNVYATDAIVATLMCATRSVISWDIV